MRISVVTACLNNRTTIEHTLKSVLGQTLPDIEIIVVDGGSTDGTLEIIRKYAGRISTIISEKDEGIYDALNKGIRAAKGDVVGFLHADDVFENAFVLEKIMRCFSRGDCDGVYGDLVYVNPNDTGKVVRYWRSGPFNPEKLRQGWFPPHPTVYLKKSVYEKYGAFDLSYRIAADYDVLLRFLLDNKLRIKYLPEVLIRMRLGGTSNRTLGSLCRKSREDYRILKKHAVPAPMLALVFKNISKIPQFFYRGNIRQG